MASSGSVPLREQQAPRQQGDGFGPYLELCSHHTKHPMVDGQQKTKTSQSDHHSNGGEGRLRRAGHVGDDITVWVKE
jgi:hypothetical protein